MTPTAEAILVADLGVKTGAGLALLVAPRVSLLIAGLPRGNQFLLGRLLGALLIAIAGAALLEADRHTTKGLGLHGLAVINLTGGLVLVTLLLLPNPFDALRGRLLLWLFALAMLGAGVAQIIVP